MKFFSLIYQGDIHPATDKKVIPKEEYSTLANANEILEMAKEDANEHKKKTHEECEKLKKEAKEEGFKEGLSLFNQHAVYFEAELKKLRHEMQQKLLPLVLKAAKKVVSTQLELKPDTIVDIVLATLTPLTQNHRITIFVNKADLEILEKEKPRIKEILEQLESLKIKDRNDIEPGGCVIETESGIINATLENQWRSIENAFEKYMKKSYE